MSSRIEKDSLGEVEIQENKIWGAQTQRSIENFNIGDELIPDEVINAYAVLKKAAAQANAELTDFDKEKASLIEKVCDEILDGKLNQSFPLKVWQTGSGTQTNMNLNEVISNRAQLLRSMTLDETRFLSPNDDVNKSQSSNDTFPTAMNISAYKILRDKLVPSLENLKKEFSKKSEDFKEIVKIGRTHFMDATPLTLGQVFSAYVSQLDHGLKAIENTLDHLRELPIGGTAVGTGLNTPEGFDKLIIKKINSITNFEFSPSPNKFEAIAAHDALVETHGAIKQVAVSLMKIANDIRMLGSGPRSGIGEISLPANEPGSSIMPGKVNPTQCEALTMVCAQVMGNDVAISIGGMSGQFELNAFKPLMIYNFLQSARILSDAMESFRRNCVVGITANKERIKAHLDNSLMLVTALNPHIGYENAAKIAKAAFNNGTTLKEEALNSGLLTESEFEKWVKPEDMI